MPFLPKLHSTLSSTSVSTSHSHSHSGHHTPTNSSSSTNNIANNGTHPFDLSLDLESPPIILYGPPSESSGSLISGQLIVDIPKDAFVDQKHSSQSNSSTRPSAKKTPSTNAITQSLTSTLSNLNLSPSHSNTVSPVHSNNNSSSNLMGLLVVKDHILINSVQLSLVQKITLAKPFLPPSNTLSNCSSCKKQSIELARWDIMTQAHNLPSGKHSYPFSHLLPGNLPATSTLGSSSLTSIKYELVAIASYNNHQNHQGIVKIVLPLNISRSILRGPDRNSLRVFPPTDVTATAVLPNVIYPKSSFALELKLDGVASNGRRWRMRRVGWRIEEHNKVKASACSNHKAKLRVVEEHIRKQQLAHKPNNVKRNQQSGPTTNVSVTNTPQGLAPTLSPSESAANTPVPPGGALSPNGSDDNISTAPSDLHPNDHAHEELRQQQESQAAQKQEPDYALYCEETRTVASGDLRNGWKSDFTGKGKIELVADLACFNLSSAAGPHHTHVSYNEPINTPILHPTVSCDIDDPVLGITTSHVLIVEVVIAEEALQSSSHNPLSSTRSHDSTKSTSSNNNDQRLAELSPVFANHIKPTQTTPAESQSSPSQSKTHGSSVVGVPTGSARVLRMQFKVIVTERSGLGIAWDDEVPPMYDDVSALSPPTYDKAVDQSPISSTDGTNPPLYPLNFAPVHTHTHINGSATPGVIYGISNTPIVTPRPSGHYHSIQGTLDTDDFTLS